ncbi:leucine-rich repeat-containing protein [Tanacetum coccineum]
MMNWNTSTDYCKWDGVTCDRSIGDVVGLDLHCERLQGTIHPNSSLFNLPHLKTLNLAYNHFTEQLPREIGVCSNSLTHLNLSICGFTSQVPPDITLLHKLVSLDLSFNYDFMMRPHVFNNIFSGKVTFESFTLPSLRELYLRNNDLAGHTDMQTFQKLTNLTHLSLSHNNFSGEWELDALLSCLTNLEILNLSNNSFFVTTKNANHYVNPGFKLLRLASCKLKLFLNSFRAMKQLRYLDLSSSGIHGQIPHWSNLIEGPFPISICNMSNLRYLDMSNNRFGGLIPQCFGNVTSYLLTIDMGNNSFQGTIPSLYNDCENLQWLILKGNQLEGELPRSLSKCRSLRVIDLGNNHLYSTFPRWLGELLELQVVLKSNKFHGHIQPPFAVEFLPFQNLQVLKLSHNRFVGQLLAKYFQNFNSMKNVVQNSFKPIYLMGGEIASTISFYSFVVTMKGVDQDIPRLFVNLTIIDLSNNYFGSEITNIIGNLSSLKVLNLSHNHLNSQIPYSLKNLSEIESLDLSWNQLAREIPKSLAGIKGLKVLSLSHNLLVGRIPDGTQFKTFDKNSFEGNVGLCGYPLPKKCSEYTHKPQLEARDDQEEESGFTREVVMLGYGCGTLLGLVMGYFMLSTRKVKWLALLHLTCDRLLFTFRNTKHFYHLVESWYLADSSVTMLRAAFDDTRGALLIKNLAAKKPSALGLDSYYKHYYLAASVKWVEADKGGLVITNHSLSLRYLLHYFSSYFPLLQNYISYLSLILPSGDIEHRRNLCPSLTWSL